MLFPLQRIIEGRKPPLCIQQDATVADALKIMVGNHYNQLPVVDHEGRLTGLISNQTIMRTYYHSAGKVPLLTLAVSHCQEPAVTLSQEIDLFTALNTLNDRDVYAIVVVENGKPIGILTGKDMTHFFRELYEGLILVEDVELTLRRYSDTAFPTPEAMNTALIAAFGADRNDKEKPARDYEYLSFGDQIRLITEHQNWHKFQKVFEPQELFYQVMTQVRITRNQLAHFRGRPEGTQLDALKLAIDWLATRPELNATSSQNSETAEPPTADPVPQQTADSREQ